MVQTVYVAWFCGCAATRSSLAQSDLNVILLQFEYANINPKRPKGAHAPCKSCQYGNTLK